MEQTQFKRFKKITLILITSLFLIFGTCHLSYCVNQNTHKTEMFIDSDIDNTDVPTIKPEINKYDSAYVVLLDEITKYIKQKAPKAYDELPKYLLDAALEHDIDLCFMMAQTQLETNFGTLGAGREVSRRSLFGVNHRKYLSYENAIDDYCRLLHKYYLGRGRTEEHLLNKYTTHSGLRYAENPRYEANLKTHYKNILRSTNIRKMQIDIKNIT